MLKATFAVDTSEERLKESQRLLKLIFYIVDRVCTLRLSPAARAKTDKNRKEAEKVRQREKKDE